LKLQGELARQNSKLRELNWELSRIHSAIEEDLDARVVCCSYSRCAVSL